MCRLSLTTCVLFPRRHHVYVYVYTSFSSHWSVDVKERHVSIIVILYKLNELTLHYYLYIWANYHNPHACNVNSLLGSFRMISLLRNQSPWKSILLAQGHALSDVDMIETGDVDYLHWSFTYNRSYNRSSSINGIIWNWSLILICQSWKISSSEVVPQLLKHCLGLGVRSILYWPTWMTFARMVIHPKCVYHLSAKDVNGCISKPNTSIYTYIYIYIIHIYIKYYTYIYTSS